MSEDTHKVLREQFIGILEIEVGEEEATRLANFLIVLVQMDERRKFREGFLQKGPRYVEQ